jgi:hypothetical protein
MKPAFEKIQLNKQVVLIIRKDSSSFAQFEREISGTVVTINDNKTSDTASQPTDKTQAWVLRDETGEIFIVPYIDIESAGYIFPAA